MRHEWIKELSEDDIFAITGTIKRKLLLSLCNKTYVGMVLRCENVVCENAVNTGGLQQHSEKPYVDIVTIDLDSATDMDLGLVVLPYVDSRNVFSWQKMPEKDKDIISGRLNKSIFNEYTLGDKIKCSGFDTGKNISIEKDEELMLFAAPIIERVK